MDLSREKPTKRIIDLRKKKPALDTGALTAEIKKIEQEQQPNSSKKGNRRK